MACWRDGAACRVPGTAVPCALVTGCGRAFSQRCRGGDGQDLFSRLSRFTDSSRRQLRDGDVVDHVFGMLFAAHETTASAMALMMYSLARHREWQAQVRTEIVARNPGEPPTLEGLAGMPVVEAVFRETLRLYAPVQFLPRRNVRPFEWSGQRIPANSHVTLPPQLCHRDPALFEDPNSFQPERFLDGPTLRPVDPFAWVPFGRGSHMCMGTHLALLEVKALFVPLLRLFDLELSTKREPTLQHVPLVRPRGRLPITFVRR